MRQGYRVIDMDTHVNPTLDVLLHYADRDLQSRKGDLKPYTRVIKPRQGRGESEDEEQVSMFIIKPIRYSRIAGKSLRLLKTPAAQTTSLAGRVWSPELLSKPEFWTTTPRAVCRTWT